MNSEDEKILLLALTQLQPTDASRLLPCFDEPEMKAAFKISIIHPIGTSAISNSPIRRYRNLNLEWSETEFEVSPVMSTYLLAIAVSDFVFKLHYCKNIQVRVWCQHTKLNDISYVLHILCRLLTYYEKFFAIPYPLKKLDVFAVPELRVLAMENWGLIVVRQKLILYNERLNSLRERRVVTDVIAHEVAHMWFGNLATMRWWNDLWLNEGFATMIGQKAADFSQYFAAEITLRALSSDQYTKMTQPISLRATSDRIHSQDIKIIYNKGAAVIRMVESTVGSEVFQMGLNHYLLKFAYSNAEKKDLLNCFSKIFKATNYRHYDPFSIANVTASDYIDSWIYQRGFPLLKVRQSGNYFEIGQKIFDFDNSTEFASTQWNVPIFIQKNGRDELYWLEAGKTVKILFREPRVFVIDPKFHGYYRTEYELQHWKLLTRHLLNNHSNFLVSTRIKLLDDAFVLAENGHIPYAIAMKMSLYLRNENEVVPFITFLARFELILFRLYRHPNASRLNKFLQFLMEPPFDRINEAESNSHLLNEIQFEILRELIYLKMCASGYQRCIQQLRLRLQALYVNCSHEKLEASSRNVAYMVASKYGNESELSFLVDKFHAEEYHAERDRIFSALASTSNQTYLKE
ncbi:unnamed protein product [Thelazia callipaeda]|uniref:Aminopeptidase n=1 Tax=Thelazia callipaeda TaxID=103827 RepID=A0A0N5CR41_THECL|nr:unnamed protein product [Thelazia callipaeda]